MIFWFVLLLLWFVLVVFVNVNIPTALWFFLLLLWVGVAVHYAIIYRNWKEETNIRKLRREEQLKNGGTT